MNKYAIICARGGSERVKHKNIRPLNDKPLIAYTIQTALDCKIFNKVIVNSEDDKILAISKKFGADLYLRPEHLAGSSIFVIEVIQEMINTMDLKDSDIIGILFPTCPLREVDDIHQAFNLFQKNEFKSPVVSVTAFDYPIQIALSINSDNYLTPVFKNDYKKSTRHTDYSNTYRANFAIIFNSVCNLRIQSNLIGKKPLPYVMPPERSIDIDDKFQFNLAELLMEKEIKN